MTTSAAKAIWRMRRKEQFTAEGRCTICGEDLRDPDMLVDPDPAELVERTHCNACREHQADWANARRNLRTIVDNKLPPRRVRRYVYEKRGV